MYTVKCKYCNNSYESGSNRSGICPTCKKTAIGRKNTKYRDKTYDQIMFYVPKGEKERLKEYVSEKNMSMNEFVTQAIGYYIEYLETQQKEGNI